jgi:adenosylhomocysteine nucleosidase
MKILVFSALPQEWAPLKKLFPALRAVHRKPYAKFSLNLPGKEIALVESGMGENSVKAALGAELETFWPELIIFSGFAGGLHPDLCVGAVCVASGARSVDADTVYTFGFPEELSDFLAKNRVAPVLALTAKSPGNKRLLSTLACAKPAVLDMETASIAREACLRKIPFLCFRAISDAIDQELGFDLEDICDKQCKVRLLRVIALIFKRPATLFGFFLLWRNSSVAAKKLCSLLADFLDLPAEQLARMAARITCQRR